MHPFEKLNYSWKQGKAPIYIEYQILWAHKYHSCYKPICEQFLMPHYQLIFIEECKCMSEGALEAIREYGDYLFSKKGTYLRMYGGNKAPSLLPKYATDYIVHKEGLRQLFLEGFESFLFDMKKAVFLPIPFYVGSYKFSKVKSTS